MWGSSWNWEATVRVALAPELRATKNNGENGPTNLWAPPNSVGTMQDHLAQCRDKPLTVQFVDTQTHVPSQLWDACFSPHNTLEQSHGFARGTPAEFEKALAALIVDLVGLDRLD